MIFCRFLEEFSSMKLDLLSNENKLMRVQNSGTITLVDVNGDNPLEELLGPDCFQNKILLDLEQTNYIDTAAVSWLIHCHKECQNAGGRFIIHSVPPMVLQMLELLRMNEILNMVGDQAQALAMAQGAQK
jgi:anti-anti-sigma factor